MPSSESTVILPVRQYSLTAALLSYLVPGLGQIYQGRTGKGVLFMVCLLGMFIAGNAMGNWQNVYLPDSEATKPNGEPVFPDNAIRIPGGQSVRLTGPLRALFLRFQYLGQFWIGIAAWPAIWQYNSGPVPSEETSPFLHNLQRFPDETRLNEELTNSDKTPDVAWVYTVIAGMLNILVIYDAYAGPAFLLSGHAGSKPQPRVPT
jgi:hypothetical protein